jgi:hypothetical protein
MKLIYQLLTPGQSKLNDMLKFPVVISLTTVVVNYAYCCSILLVSWLNNFVKHLVDMPKTHYTTPFIVIVTF